MSKKTTREYADELRAQKARDTFDAQNGNPPGTGSGPAGKLEMPPELGEDTGEDPPDPGALGLALFDSTASDIIEWTPERRALAQQRGYTMVERYLSLSPGKGCEAYILGWSAGLLPSMNDATRLRYTRRLHLELMSGARVSLLEAAQLTYLFSVPMDGSVGVEVFKGGESIRNGRRMGHWEAWVKPLARKPQHEPGKSYAQLAAEAVLLDKLGAMTTAELSRVDGAPVELLDFYMGRARKRELDAEIARRAQTTVAQGQPS